MSEPTDKPRFSLPGLAANDPVKHFAKDGPKWKLSALLIQKLPAIFGSLGLLTLSVVLAVSRFWR